MPDADTVLYWLTLAATNVRRCSSLRHSPGKTPGRKPIILIPMCVLMILILPVYWVMDHYRSMQVLYGVSALLSILAGFSSAPIKLWNAESLPAQAMTN